MVDKTRKIKQSRAEKLEIALSDNRNRREAKAHKLKDTQLKEYKRKIARKDELLTNKNMRIKIRKAKLTNEWKEARIRKAKKVTKQDIEIHAKNELEKISRAILNKKLKEANKQIKQAKRITKRELEIRTREELEKIVDKKVHVDQVKMTGALRPSARIAGSEENDTDNQKTGKRAKGEKGKCVPTNATNTVGKFLNSATYSPATMPEVAFQLCARYGADSKHLCTAFAINQGVLMRWRFDHKDFNKAIIAGRDYFNVNKLEKRLLIRATGYEYTEYKYEDILIGKDKLQATRRTKTIRHLPADVPALIFYLKNRQPERWRDIVRNVGIIDHKINVKGEIKIDDSHERTGEVVKILLESGALKSLIGKGVKTKIN